MYLARLDTGGAPFQISLSQADELNSRGYGIFKTVNDFTSSRKKESLLKINSWFFEIDQKIPLDDIISKLLLPSLVVETKNGYHVYFTATDASVEKYSIIQHRICEFYSADPNALDLTRMLRVPGYYHCKDQKNKFLCRVVFCSDVSYREALMMTLLPKCSWEMKQEKELKPNKKNNYLEGNFNSWIDSQNQMELLSSLSGSSLVYGDVFSFKRISGNRFNTKTNSKDSAWFIDENGRIGSSSGGGPTVVQFVAWYKIHSGMSESRALAETYKELKKFFHKEG